MGGSVELLDTPGILWPKFDNQEIGMRLALVGAIRNEILDRVELAIWLLDYLQREYGKKQPRKKQLRKKQLRKKQPRKKQPRKKRLGKKQFMKKRLMKPGV